MHDEFKCTRCKGNGVVEHPEWMAFWKKHTPEKLRRASDEERDQIYIDHFGIDGYVPEEIDCPDCKGTGRRPIEECLDILGRWHSMTLVKKVVH